MAGILPFGAVFIELFFILSVSKHDISIKNYIIVSLESILILLLIEHKSVTQWAEVFIVHISNHPKFICSRDYNLNDQCSVICFQAIWENQFYYLFGFLFLVFVILSSCVSQISIVMIYFQLCAEVCLVIMLKNFTVYFRNHVSWNFTGLVI